MKRVVILQPQFFPWVGVFEQLRLADVFVHFDNVQFPQGRSFLSRVQIRTASGSTWLSVPVKRSRDLIRDIRLSTDVDWRKSHLRTLDQTYARAPYREEMLGIVRDLYARPITLLSELNRIAIEEIAGYFGLSTEFRCAGEFDVTGRSSELLLNLVTQLNGSVYLTGHGARDYLDHELLETSGVEVEYMSYERTPYSQTHGGFDPHVSILDLIANCGREGASVIRSGSISWKEFLNEPA